MSTYQTMLKNRSTIENPFDSMPRHAVSAPQVEAALVKTLSGPPIYRFLLTNGLLEIRNQSIYRASSF